MVNQARAGVARLRLVWVNRRYFQSTPGHKSSQRSAPPEFFSSSTASSGLQVRKPYATLLRCPEVVLQRSANSARSDRGMDFQKSSNAIAAEYHPTVIEKATPSGQFTKRCLGVDNEPVGNQAAALRRQNLKRLIARDFAGNLSAIARAHDPENPKPNYFSDLLREGSGKSFGEKAARKIEERVGLRSGQLDVEGSQLAYDDAGRNRVRDEIRLAIDNLDRDEQREALAAIRKIQGRRQKRA